MLRFEASVANHHLKSVCKGNVDQRTAIYMNTVLEYMTKEIAELSSSAAREHVGNKQAVITQLDLEAAVERDSEIIALMK